MKKLLALVLLVAATLAADVDPRQLLAAGRVDDLTSVLKQRLQASPNDAEAHHLLARAYYAQQRWDDAIAEAQRAVALAPDNSEYHHWLARAYGEKADSSSFLAAAGLAKKVRAELERTVKLDPKNVQARADLAEFYLEAPGFLGGGKEKALAQAEALAKLDPPRAHWVKARVAQKNGDDAGAEREYRAAIQASNNQPRYWLNLASFYRRANRLTEMEEAVSKAVAAQKNHPEVLVDAAGLLFRAGRNFPAASQLLRQYLSSAALSEEAPAFQAHYLLGSLLEKSGDKQGAAGEYRAALTLARDYKRAQEALKRVSR